jgi:hypothetical protein
MQIATESTPALSSQEPPATACPPCPVCSGPLVCLRNQYRCSRCYYCFCVGCEDGPVANGCGSEG